MKSPPCRSLCVCRMRRGARRRWPGRRERRNRRLIGLDLERRQATAAARRRRRALELASQLRAPPGADRAERKISGMPAQQRGGRPRLLCHSIGRLACQRGRLPARAPITRLDAGDCKGRTQPAIELCDTSDEHAHTDSGIDHDDEVR